jgi:hypothetical protein
MNISAAANSQYTAYPSQRSSSGQAAKPNLTQIILYDLGSGQPVLVKRPDISIEDMELHVYALQLAVELGIVNEKDFLPQGEYWRALQELLDDGSISREDIINAVKYPPKIDLEEDSDFIHSLCAKKGIERYAMELNYKSIETTRPIKFSSASELFEIIWGKEGV